MSNSGDLRVNHGALDTASQRLNSAANSIQARLDAMDQDLAPLRADWEGDAQRAYQEAKAKWDGKIQEMHQILQQSSQDVDVSNMDYAHTDRNAASMFHGI